MRWNDGEDESDKDIGDGKKVYHDALLAARACGACCGCWSWSLFVGQSSVERVSCACEAGVRLEQDATFL